MANRFRTNILSLSGIDITLSTSDTTNYLRHDGAFADPLANHVHNYVTGLTTSGSSPLTGLVTVTGIGGLNIIFSGNTIVYSGGAGGAGEANTASNLGVGSGLFGQKSSVDLQFRSLRGGSGIQISGDSDTLTLIVTGIGGTAQQTDTSNLTGTRNTQFGLSIDAGYSYIATGFKSYIRAPKTMNISSWEIVSNASGSIVIDVWKTGFANFPPVNSIAGNQKPTLTSQISNSSGSLTGWISGVNQGDYLGFAVNSCSRLKRVTLSIYGTST